MIKVLFKINILIINVAFDGSISEHLSLDYTLTALDIIGHILGYYTHLGH